MAKELSDNFAIMQEKLDKPSCLGKYGKPAKGLKCGHCWFNPVCKERSKQKKINTKKSGSEEE